MAGADLVLSRSGATTCAELAVAGRTGVLVPFARAADDHQRTNARALAEAGAACMIEEKDLTGETLAREINRLVASPERISEMEAAARRRGRPDAARRLADLLLAAAEGEPC
jgi:UDP-N-acetylglucosamine--N-acetylmuramyl-(pentapeptide) pyrophosphoryl-undecaprenol N-acetylglucosamine transferase